jgi:aspartyl-tRNA(Asn)/glutamyl-tRNA(Gln) amidotransferase subunit A
MDVKDLTIKTFHEGLVGKEFSAVEVAEALSKEIEEQDGGIHAFLRTTDETALVGARGVDEDVVSGRDIGMLAGVPLAVKDNILQEGELATAASKALEHYRASYDATVITKLREKGVVLSGRTNLDEFAMGASTENSAFGSTRNPHDLERVPGGSSGGSAAAVASGMAVAALGSDTGGSIRQPASFCGVAGLRPTYGSVSRSGLIAMASSLDVIGPITKTVEDAALLFEAIAGGGELDATSFGRGYNNLARIDAGEVKKLTIGLPHEYFVEGLDSQVKKEIEATIARLKKLGFEFAEVSLPHTKYALSCYYIVVPAEVSANMSRFDGVRYSRVGKGGSLSDIYFEHKGKGFGPEVRRRVLLGTFVLSHGYYDAYYGKAQKVRRLIRNDFEKVFEDVDVLLTPVAPTPAFKLGEKASDPLQMYLSDVFTCPASLAGLPALSVPTRRYEIGSGELPVGFQLIGRRFGERDVLGIGQLYERGA